MKPNLKSLLSILSTKRPHGGLGEKAIAQKFLKGSQLISDKKGKPLAHLIVTDPQSRVLFSSHLDTVAHEDGVQQIIYDKNLELVYVPQGAKECLGADDGAGVWLMLEMIKAGVKGSFLFHYGEEVGGIGSRGIASEHSEFLRGFDKAIAFDRKGSQDIITHQGGGRTASDEFALALAAELDMGHKPDDSGTFTDTSNYSEIIQECSNLSIGYSDCHTPNETLDVEYLLALRKACIKVDWESLPASRDPSVVEDLWAMPMWNRRRVEMEFTIVEFADTFKLYDESEDFLQEHESAEFLEGYAACLADMDETEAFITYEHISERKLRLAGYNLDDLDDDSPYGF